MKIFLRFFVWTGEQTGKVSEETTVAFQYGSTDLGIRNPFKFEGAMRSIAGAFIASLGIYNLISVQALVTAGNKMTGWIALGIGIFLLAWGLSGIGRGVFQLSRFFVGRSIPASLSKNVAKSERHVNEPRVAYTAKHLEQMLQGRKNLTFTEPKGWLDRIVHSIFSDLLFLPYAYRNMIVRVSQGLSNTLIALVCFGLVWFSGASGLTPIENTPILDWTGFVLTVYILVNWWKKRNLKADNLMWTVESISLSGLVVALVASILLPVGLFFVHQNVARLPDLQILNVHVYIFSLIFMALVGSAAIFTMVFMRLSKVNPATEVSEFRENWQESIHPQEIFINFEDIVMADRRFKEYPNRIYRDFDANLIEEGSNDKGRFNGEMIQEVQPTFREMETSPAFKTFRKMGTLIGFMMLSGSAVLLNLMKEPIANTIRYIQTPSISSDVLNDSFAMVFAFLIVFILGSMIVNAMHLFWSELQFESLLVYFKCQGTYTESKLSTGASIYDSTRSENTVVRSSLTPWLLASRLVTSCFAKSGMHNLDTSRHILEMHKADSELTMITRDLKNFLSSRESIAGIRNEKDLNSASNIYEINAKTRTGLTHQDTDSNKRLVLDQQGDDSSSEENQESA